MSTAQIIVPINDEGDKFELVYDKNWFVIGLNKEKQNVRFDLFPKDINSIRKLNNELTKFIQFIDADEYFKTRD